MDNKLIIINYLGKHPHQAYTMLALSKITKIPYATFHRTIQEMKDLLLIQTVGKAKTITLTTKNTAIKAYLTISSEEEKKTYLKWRSDVTSFTVEMKSNFPDFDGKGAVAFLKSKWDVNQVALDMARQHLSSVRTQIAQYSIVATAQPCPSCNTPLTMQGGKIVCADCPSDVAPEVVLNLAKTKEASLIREQGELL